MYCRDLRILIFIPLQTKSIVRQEVVKAPHRSCFYPQYHSTDALFATKLTTARQSQQKHTTACQFPRFLPTEDRRHEYR